VWQQLSMLWSQQVITTALWVWMECKRISSGVMRCDCFSYLCCIILTLGGNF
jgi:hypothetical protein